MPICDSVSAIPEPSSVRRLAIVPTIVTSSPSRIHTAPRPMTTSQCQRAHGSRSIRAGMFVSIVRSSTESGGHAGRAYPPGVADNRHRAERAPAARVAHARAEAREVLTAVGHLPDAFRDVVLMVDVAGLGYAEGADALGVPKGTVMSRLSRGRDAVAAELGAIPA